MNKIRRRQYEQRIYSTPEELLHANREAILRVFRCETMEPRDRRATVERHHAAMHCLLLREFSLSASDVRVSVGEQDDSDCVVRMTVDSNHHFLPIQLKELPDAATRERLEFQSEISKLEKYVSPDTIVSYWINRDIEIDFGALCFDKLRFAQLWLIGQSTQDVATLQGGTLPDWKRGVYWDCQWRGDEKWERKVRRFRNGPQCTNG